MAQRWNTPRPTPPRPDTPRPGTPYQFPPSTPPLDLSTSPFNSIAVEDLLPGQLDLPANPLLFSEDNWSLTPNPPRSPQIIDIEEDPGDEIYFSDLDLEEDAEIQVVTADEVIEEEDSEVPGPDPAAEDDLGATNTSGIPGMNEVGPAEMLGRLLNCPQQQNGLPHLHRLWNMTQLSRGTQLLKPSYLLSKEAQKNLLQNFSPTDLIRNLTMGQNTDIYIPLTGMFVDRVTGIPLPSLQQVNYAEGITASIPLPWAAILGLPVYAAYPSRVHVIMLFKTRLASLIYKLQEELDLPEDRQTQQFVANAANQVKTAPLTLIN